jgi:hypothetical protein
MSKTPVRPPTFVAALFGSIWRDVRDLFRNPLAFLGGVGGTVLTFALLLASFVVFGGEASADAEAEDDALELDFEPGTLVKLGIEPEEKEIPEKIITQETRAEEETTTETITEDENQKPKDDIEPEEKEPKKKPSKNPDKKDKKLPTAKNPTTKNTPYDDLPTVDYNIGDPFGDPKGWADRLVKGDKWATAIMRELNNAGTMTAGAEKFRGTYKFRLQLCPNGKIGKIQPKGGNLDSQGQSFVTGSLERLRVKFHYKVPADVAKKMKGRCQYVKGTFVWKNGVISFGR